MRRLVALGLAVVAIAGCGATDTPIQVQRVSMSLTDSSSAFGVALLDRLLAEQDAGNVFISPLSATIALSMAASAADPSSRAAILKVLGVDPAANADQHAKETIDRLAQSDANAQVALAQAAWAQNGLKLNPAYVQRLHDYYQAELSNLDFASPAAPGVVNKWVDSKTHGKITKLVDQFDPSTVGYLVNATYFHALWATEFKPMSTPIDFHDFAGTTSSPPAMHRDDSVIVSSNDLYQAALLPYKGGRFSAVLILSRAIASPAEFADLLSPSLWAQTMTAFHGATGETLTAPCAPVATVSCDWTLQMPKFTLDYRKDLMQTLAAMGMPVPGASMPDFCGGCFIGDVVQATRLEVDEKGTTAAAATGVAVPASLKIPMTVDRPFAFALVDNATDAPLFLGVIGNLS
jgi:serine protease inhibitor